MGREVHQKLITSRRLTLSTRSRGTKDRLEWSSQNWKTHFSQLSSSSSSRNWWQHEHEHQDSMARTPKHSTAKSSWKDHNGKIMIGLVSVPTRHRTQETQLVCRNTVTHCGALFTGQAHKHVRKRRQHDRRLTNRTHRLAAHWWVPVGTHTGLQQASRDTTKTTRLRFTALRLGNQDGSGTSLNKPQICEAATEFSDKKTFTSPPQILGETKTKSSVPDSVEVPQVQCEPVLMTPSRTQRQCHQ